MFVMKVDSYQVDEVKTSDPLYQSYSGKVVNFVHMCRLG